MHPVRLAVLAALAVLGLAAGPAAAQLTLTTTRVASGLSQPLYVTHAPGDATRLFIVERAGRIKILDLTNGTILPTPFLDVSALVSTSWLEYGLLGLAFHPDYQTNGIFYVNYNPAGATIADTLVARYRVSADPNVADPAGAATVLRVGYGTRREHRAGWMGFGPDGYLYVSTGDGGENDPDNAAQDLALLRGKILRIDVNGPDGVPGTDDDDGFPADDAKLYHIPPTNPFVGIAGEDEIWAYGLRNPWRCSFDRLTGDLYIGDVGQGQREEIDFQPAGATTARNYGWRCTEGTFCTGLTGCTCHSIGLTLPIHQYPHSLGLSVTGGYVYRGCAIPDSRGTYFFADYQLSKVFSFRYDGQTLTQFTDRTAELAPGGGLNLQAIASLGEDADGELYFCDYGGGEIFKLVPRNPVPPVTITQQPTPFVTCPGGTASFTVAAAGGPFTYQWRFGGEEITLAENPTARSATLTIEHAAAGDAGSYDVVVTGPCGSITSAAAMLIVCRADTDCGGGVNSGDISSFLTAWLASIQGGTLEGDFNGDMVVNSVDISSFLTAWLDAVQNGC